MSELPLTSLEAAVLVDMLRALGADPDVSEVRVRGRTHSGIGFLTELAGAKNVPVRSLRWSSTSARLNDALDAGFVVYVDDGVVQAIEGFIYDGTWPTVTTSWTVVRT